MFSFLKKVVFAIATYYSSFSNVTNIPKLTIEKDFFCRKWILVQVDEPDFTRPDPHFADVYSYKLTNYDQDSLLQEVLILNSDSSYQVYKRSVDKKVINTEDGQWHFYEKERTILFKCRQFSDNPMAPNSWFVDELKDCKLTLKFRSRAGNIWKTYISNF
ncbi:MAG TPA: hypothetical protein VLB84_18740 [Bacteroidia bacterium]|nr:hypothetical protein [Bacteroidia bacterium]